ncbi:MAG: FliH/SctL family protein [Desulfosarcina sp.]
MSVDPTKEDASSALDTCARYYFPEISDGCESDGNAASLRDHFINRAVDPDEAPASTSAPAGYSESMQALLDDAFDKGLTRGRTEIAVAQQEAVNQATAALRSTVEELLRVRRQEVDRMEIETVQLSLAIAKTIIGREAEQGTLIRQTIKAAMQKVADPRGLLLRLNPRDIDTVACCEKEWLPTDDTGAGFRIEADQTVQRGGCVIETRLGDVDARLERQLQVIEEGLKAQLPRPLANGC